MGSETMLFQNQDPGHRGVFLWPLRHPGHE